MKMDHDNLRKSYTGKLPDRIWKLDKKQRSSVRKQQSGMIGLEWDQPYQWKVSPMMKNQTAKIKKVKSW
jgi:hypothetical protein